MRRRIALWGNGNKTKGWILSNAIIKATAATAAAATLLGVGVTPAFADQTAAPDGGQGQNQTQPTAHERLAAAIKAADAKTAQDRDWDKESKDAFDKAYAAAKAVGDDASDQDAATAASALETATDGLKSAAEKALDDAKAQAGTLKESDYTKASWQALKSALDDADALKATDDKAGDAQRRSKADAITAAVNGLDLQARADLSDSIAAAKAKRDGGRVWTADSKGTLDDILEQADKLVGESHDKTALASMKDSVDKAAGNLESQPTADLKAAIARCNALDLSRFTESERESVKEARGSAKTADRLADNADNDTVRADAARDLNAAIDALSYPAVERLDKAVRAADAKAARDRDWDKDSKAAFDKAYEAAKGPFDDTKAGDVERVKAAESLEDATKSLTTVQRVELKAEARKADAIDRTRLTDESAKALKDAIDAAGTDPSDDKAGDDRAAELTGALRTAEKNAESKTHAAVREAIARYDDMVTADGHRDWTDTTAATNAYTAAKGTLSDEDTVDHDIARQKAADQLAKSLDALTTRQQDAYAAAVKAANARLADGKYTQDSRNTLKEELDRDGGLGKATDKAGDMERAAAAGRINAAIDATVRVSRANLDAAIGTATAKGSQERDWDRTTRKAFDEALAAAQAAGGDADDATLDDLSDALSKATAALTTTQRTTFSATVDKAEAMAKDARYTAGSHTRLTAAVGTARNDVASSTDDKAGDDRYAAATATLRTVMDAPEYETGQSLKDAIASADALNARGLTYGSGMAGEKSAFDDAYAKAKRDRNKDGDTQKADASALDRAQKALVGKSDQEKAYSGAASNARALKAQDYTEDSYGRLDALLTDGFDSGSATGKELDARAKAISDAIDALEVSSWTVDGATLTQEDGEWTGHVTLDGAPKDVKAVGADGRTVDLKAAGGSFVQGSGKLGIGVVSGTLTGSGSRASFKVAYEYADGTETTVSDGGPGGGAVFSKGDDGVWSATYAGTLGTKDDPAGYDTDRITLSDGSTLDRTSLSGLETAPIHVDGKPDKTQLRRTAVFEGEDSHGSKVRVTGELTYTYDASIGLSLSYTAADGTTVPVSVPGMPTTVDRLPDSIVLPAQSRSLLDMKWSVSAEKGGSVSDVSTTSTVKPDGTEVILASIRYIRRDGDAFRWAVRHVRVTVPFQSAPKVVGDDKAALKGFTVNGKALEGYSKDVVDYTIHAGADERVLVVPVPEAGQDVRAGDSRQTAYATTQWWTVSKDGESRTYSVTLVRDHATPTADEAFKPSDPTGLVSKDPNPSEDNTTLKSVGYTLKDVYHPADGDSVTIPEGGTFAYESYDGQTVDVTSARKGGMTWTYSIGVLASDGRTYAVRDVTVTYLTAATHKAELTGIKADGRLVSGFDPKRLEYTVKVGNADRYVITPVFDKTTGTSVTVHKDGRTVTLTATSADGLVRTVYTVHVESDAALAALSSTGKGVGPAAAIAALLAMLGIGVGVASRRREM